MNPSFLTKVRYFIYFILLTGLSPAPAIPGETENGETIHVKLSKHIGRIEITKADRTVVIERIQDPASTIPPPFDKTSRPCPPYCIQPIVAAPGVETLGELELIAYLQKSTQSDDVLIIDTRPDEWYERQTIPLAINLPYDQFQDKMPYLLEKHFNAKRNGDKWDFSNAKTLVLFCNGYWNPDSYQVVQRLLSLGYPADKIKWYRGGMQSWLSLGLTTEKPK